MLFVLEDNQAFIANNTNFTARLRISRAFQLTKEVATKSSAVKISRWSQERPRDDRTIFPSDKENEATCSKLLILIGPHRSLV